MSRIRQTAIRAILVGALGASLAGCFELAVGTAVVTGFAASDRRTFGAQTEDKGILVKGEAKIANNFPDAHVNVTPFNRRVLLTGEAKDEATRTAIEREIAAIENVHSVANEIEIAGVSNLSSRSSDTLVTTRVKAALVEEKNFSSTAVKVVTERGNVYLLGRVTVNEGNIAAEVASNVSGVRKVIKLFEYISEEEKARLAKGG